MADKVVLVTGGVSGIGRATATEFAKHGYDVIINYVREDDAANALKQDLEERYHINATTYRADVSDEAQVNAMMAYVGEKYGKINALVNNAGIVYDRPFSDIKIEEVKETLNVDVLGAFIVSRAAEPYLGGGGGYHSQRFLYQRDENGVAGLFGL